MWGKRVTRIEGGRLERDYKNWIGRGGIVCTERVTKIGGAGRNYKLGGGGYKVVWCTGYGGRGLQETLDTG